MGKDGVQVAAIRTRLAKLLLHGHRKSLTKNRDEADGSSLVCNDEPYQKGSRRILL